MDRKRPCLGSGPEIAEESGIADLKTIQYPQIFTSPPTKLTKYIVEQFLFDGGFHYAFSVPARLQLRCRDRGVLQTSSDHVLF